MATAAAGQGAGASLARRCGGCDGRRRCCGGGDAAVEAMLQWQKVSDLLIAASLLSIPLELLYFATCAALAPLRRVLLQLGTFIVMCGVTHLLNVLAYDRPGSRRMLVALTAAKVLGALATSATAVSLPILFPRLLRLKVRESFLRSKARQLDRDLAAVRRREDTVWRVVRAVTHHIRDSVDARTILRTTMLQLAAALRLSNCAVWMPDGGGCVLQLTHQLLADDDDKVLHHHHHHHSGGGGGGGTISVRDPDVAAVLASKYAKVLSRPGSALKAASCQSLPLEGAAAAAIRIPNFHGAGNNTSVLSSYGILVLVLRGADDDHHKSKRPPTTTTAGWSKQDLEVVQAVADQVAVALSHAAALEESQQIRHKLEEQHGALLRARSELAAATKARNTAHSAMRNAMGRPMHAVVGLLSVMQQEAAAMRRPEQRLIVDAIARTSAVSSTLMDDVMETTLPRMVDPPLSTSPSPTTQVSRRPFELRSLIRDAAFVARCLSGCGGLGFSHQLEAAGSLPEWVVGDDKRVFHLVLHMVGALLSRCHGHVAEGRALSFSVCSCSSIIAGEHQDSWIPSPLRPISFTGGNQVFVRFQIGLSKRDPGNSPAPRPPQCGISPDSGGASMRLTFAMCKRIVEMMNGDMWWASESEGLGETMTCILRFQQHQPMNPHVPGSGTYRIGVGASSAAALHFNGLRILLADDDATSMEVTRKLLGRLGCQVLPVSSGADCLSLLGGGAGADPSSFELVVLDLDGHDGRAAMDGFEVALRIRELSTTCWLLVLVAVEASGVDDSVRDLCRRAGVDGLIQKPVTLPALGAQLQRVLQNN